MMNIFNGMILGLFLLFLFVVNFQVFGIKIYFKIFEGKYKFYYEKIYFFGFFYYVYGKIVIQVSLFFQ